MKLPSFNPYLGNNTQPMGLSRYLDGLLTNMGTLLLCNLYFLLCCIPIITIGPSLLALNKVCTMLVRGKSVHATRDFFDAFRKNFKAGIVITFTVVPVLLHVGLGTFRPVKAENISEHHMHSELCMMTQETADILNETRKRGGRIVCVGTTSCRTLESLVNEDGTFEAKSKWTDIFIFPGYEFKAMDALITNFHLPESTLVMLVSAFAGRENVLNAYQEAVKERYRFFSFGDSMYLG